jgi:phosphoribosylaminoimidazole-succinocarboxamide synthase
MSGLPLLYRGSVKDVRGPIVFNGHASDGRKDGGTREAVVFDYSDAYSVFDWGKMPDALPQKGASLAIIAADWFEKLGKAETWKEFSKSPDALALRRANRFGSAFNELGEALQQNGLRTHYMGVVPQASLAQLSEVHAPFSQIAVELVSVVKPQMTSVLGRSIADYEATRAAPSPRLIPLEVVFRFSCPPGSSLLERTSHNPSYLSELGFGDLKLEPGVKWDFPVLELFTKLESTDRPLTFSEALAISGISATKLQEVLFKTAWVAGWVKSICARAGLELADGKLEWALAGQGAEAELVLVDAIGPDELRILKNGVQLSKEFLRTHYRGSAWYEAVVKAKQEASVRGSAEWKKWVTDGPTPLPPAMKTLATQLYQVLANELTGKRWFKDAWTLERVVSELGGSHSTEAHS